MSSKIKNPSSNDKYILGNEILLYQNPENKKPIWYYRFTNPTGSTQYIRKSTKTQSEALASKRAIDHYNELHARARVGSEYAEPTWNIIFNRFITKVDGERSRELAKDYNKRYWEVFFGNTQKTKIRDFFNVNDETLEQYWAWRVKFYKDEGGDKNSNPKLRSASKVKGKTSHNTLRTEAYLLKFFFVEAYRLNMIGMLPKIIMKWDKFSSSTYKLPQNNRRGRFDEESYNIVRGWWIETRKKLKKSRHSKYQPDVTSNNWAQSKDERSIYNNPFNRYNTALTYTLTISVANTGIRPVEITKLIWDDIRKFEDDDGKTYSYINIRAEVSKVNKQRDAVSRDFKETYNRFMEWREEWIRYWGREPNSNDLVFPNSRADRNKLSNEFVKQSKVKPHQSIRNLFMKLDRKSGISVYKQNVNGIAVPRTLYSFRSWFITKRLENQMDAYTLSRQVGASLEMIERYYDVNANLRFRRDITRHIKNFEMSGDADSLT
ncbi:MAG: site-specific integrase [Bacteroidota bacterium]|nr:site-specific integrase [Bacteroidota bacterium]